MRPISVTRESALGGPSERGRREGAKGVPRARGRRQQGAPGCLTAARRGAARAAPRASRGAGTR
eukprot:6465783-Pyramimonas_sp.AAC.1